MSVVVCGLINISFASSSKNIENMVTITLIILVGEFSFRSLAHSNEGSRCFNCGSYSHSLKDCPRPRDNTAVNNARKQLAEKRGSGSRAASRYYQHSTGGKFDDLKPGVLGSEVRQLLGIGVLVFHEILPTLFFADISKLNLILVSYVCCLTKSRFSTINSIMNYFSMNLEKCQIGSNAEVNVSCGFFLQFPEV